MPNFKFKIIHQNEKFQINDIFIDGITAINISDARNTIEKAYPRQLGYSCIFLQKEENETNG